jgi:hypothetical protein
MSYFIVTGKKDTPPYSAYPSREHAEAVCGANNWNFPVLGPWEVIEVAPVVTDQDVAEVMALIPEGESVGEGA